MVNTVVTSVGGPSVEMSNGFEIGNGAVGMAPGGASVEGMKFGSESEAL